MSGNKLMDIIRELTPEMLENIVGGVVTDKAENVMLALIKALKNDPTTEHTADETINFLIGNCIDNVLFEGVTEEDIRGFVTKYW